MFLAYLLLPQRIIQLDKLLTSTIRGLCIPSGACTSCLFCTQQIESFFAFKHTSGVEIIHIVARQITLMKFINKSALDTWGKNSKIT